MCKRFSFQTNAVLATLLCFICSTAVQAELPDPISLWRFEEGKGKTAVDTGPGGFHGTLVGDVAFVEDDERGSVLEFGTKESFVDTNAWITDMGNADFSMAAWIQTSKAGTAIVGKSNGDRNWSFHEKQFYLSAGTEQGQPVAGGVHFYGAPENTGQLYVQVNNGAKVTYDGSADAMTTPEWTQWNIDLASLGVNLQSVTQLSIGVQGGSGMVLIDDILLYHNAP